MRLAENTGRKNYAKNRHLRTIAQLCHAVIHNKGIYRQSETLVQQQYLIHLSSQ